MDAKLKRKWVKALRSGEYVQTTGYYEKNGSYCCLGVLACVKAGRKVTDSTADKMWRAGGSLKGVLVDKKEDMLIDLNDNGKSFRYIASYIERSL